MTISAACDSKSDKSGIHNSCVKVSAAVAGHAAPSDAGRVPCDFIATVGDSRKDCELHLSMTLIRGLWLTGIKPIGPMLVCVSANAA